MPKRDPNDISNFKKPERVGVLTSTSEPTLQASEPKKTKAAPVSKVRSAAKPKKPTKERRTQKVTVYFTEKEKQQLDDAAGLVPLAKYLIAEMQRTGVLKS